MGPFTPDILAQNDFFLLPPPGCGAFKLEPVSRLYFALPFAVSPPLRDLWTPILSFTAFFFFGMIMLLHQEHYLVEFLVDRLMRFAAAEFGRSAAFRNSAIAL